MINGLTITAAEAIKQFGLEKLIGSKCVVIAQAYGNGSVEMVFGEIADPDNCQIDEENTAVLFVEYEGDDDWLLACIDSDENLVLLDEVAP